MKNTPLYLEEVSLNAWPAIQTVLYDGWVLRFANGYTRRANSVYPLYESSLPLDDKIALCEQAYQAQGLPPIFKLTEHARHGDVDTVLAQRGYRADAHSAVQTMNLVEMLPFQTPPGFVSFATLTDDWLTSYCALSNAPHEHLAPMRQILSLMVPPHRFGMMVVAGEPVACGLVVREREYVGFYDIVVAKEKRGQGYGRAIMQGLLELGQRMGATRAYLQVMLNNQPALGLYASLGFREAYRYWYRMG